MKRLKVMALAALAIVSSFSFVSCGSDDATDTPSKEPYLLYVAWVSNDILELADVVTDGVNFSFNSSVNYDNIDGKEGRVELTGNAATDANFTISFKLKSNWKEILATKEKVYIAHAEGQGKNRGETVNVSTNLMIGSYYKEKAGDEYEAKVSGSISSLKLRSK